MHGGGLHDAAGGIPKRHFRALEGGEIATHPERRHHQPVFPAGPLSLPDGVDGPSARVGVGQRDDIGHGGDRVHGGDQLVELPLSGVVLQRDRVEGDHAVRPGGQVKLQAFRQLLHGEEGRVQTVFNARLPHVEHPLRGLPHLDDPPAGLLAAGKMQRAHFGDAVADGIVHRALGHVAAGNMRDGNAGKVGGDDCGKDLIAIPQHHQKVGTVGGEIVGKGAQGRAGSAGHTGLTVIVQRKGHTVIGKTVACQFHPRAAKGGAEMTAGGGKGQFDFRAVPQADQQRPQQAVIRPGAGHNADLMLHLVPHSSMASSAA